MSTALLTNAENTRLSVRVVQAIAAHADQSPVAMSADGTAEIAPLYETIDPDAWMRYSRLQPARNRSERSNSSTMDTR